VLRTRPGEREANDKKRTPLSKELSRRKLRARQSEQERRERRIGMLSVKVRTEVKIRASRVSNAFMPKRTGRKERRRRNFGR